MLAAFATLARWRYSLFALWLTWSASPWIGWANGDWHFFRQGSDLIVGRHPHGTPAGGVHLFANYPDLQMGPIGFVLAWPLRLLSSGDGQAVAQVAMCALALPILFLVERAALRARGLERLTDEPALAVGALVGGLVFIRAWIDLAATWTHFADVLLLGAAALAVWAVASRRPLLVGVMIGAAIGAKPWGIYLVPLAFALPRRVDWLRALAVGAGVAAAAWLPFLIGDARTLHAISQVVFPNDIESGLRALGVDSLVAPHWLRPVQFGVGLLLGGIAVARKRWSAVLLVAIASRIAIDPRVLSYYAAGLVLAALIWDLSGSRVPLPFWSLVAYFGLHDANEFVADPHLRGLWRLMLMAALAASALVLPRARRAEAPTRLRLRLRPAESPRPVPRSTRAA